MEGSYIWEDESLAQEWDLGSGRVAKWGKKTVVCKGVFTIKYKADGSIERHKARLIAKWYTKTLGIDYQEKFVLVAKMNFIRILLSLCVNLYWSLCQFDVKNAFLHGNLEEEVYIDLPLGFENLSNDKVCRLKKSLYELTQSVGAWFGIFTKFLKTYDFIQSQGDLLYLLNTHHSRKSLFLLFM